MTRRLMNCYTPYGYGYRSYYSMCGSGYYGSFGYNYYGYGYPYYHYYPRRRLGGHRRRSADRRAAGHAA